MTYEIEADIEEDDFDDSPEKKYNSLSDWQADLKTLWKGSPIKIEFTHKSNNGKHRRKIDLFEVATNSRDDLYLVGFCHLRNEKRHFDINNITTMIMYKSRRYTHFDFLNKVIGLKY